MQDYVTLGYFQASAGKIRKLCQFLGITQAYRVPKPGSRGKRTLQIFASDQITMERYEQAREYLDSLFDRES